MTRTSVVAGRRLYTISPLEGPTLGDVFQAIVVAQLIDGPTGSPLAATGVVSTTVDGLRARAAADGFVGLVGTPSRVVPGLDSQAYDIDVLLTADGYAPRHETATLPVQPGFPEAFVPADLGVLELRRAPVVLALGTYAYDPDDRPLPLAAADVSVSGYWTKVDGLGDPAATAPLLAVGGGMSAARPVGSTVDVPPLTSVPEPVRTLSAPSAAGTSSLFVSRAGGLVAGDLLGIALGTPEREEWIEVLAVIGPSDIESPCEVVLRFPTRRDHGQDATTERVTAAAAPPSLVQLTEAGLEGDRTLLVSSLAGLASGQVVRVSGGPAAPEYRRADLYSTTTDADGFGRLPAITGLAAVELAAASGALAATALVTLTQRTPTHGLDLTLT